MPHRVTLKHIAAACDVSVATVSYALRNNPRIPLATRERIKKKSKELGYIPDPTLSSLASRIQTSGQTSFVASVAILHPNPPNSRSTQLFNKHCEYFKAKMSELGCAVSDFHVDSNRYRPERLAQILRTRGIKGILLGWGKWPEAMKDFPWHAFAVISTERTTISPLIDKVSMNHFHALNTVFDHVNQYDFKRMGIILHHDCPAQTENQILGGYYANLYENNSEHLALPIYKYHIGEDGSQLKAWFKQNKPDVIISHRVIDPEVLRNAEIQFPKPTRLVVLEIDEDCSINFTGIHTGSQMGRTIAQLLARKIRNFEIESNSRTAKITLVNGTWEDGETLT